MHNLVDKAHSMMLQLQQAGGARSTELLQQHANSVFAGNTEESTRMKATDWLKYCNILHPGGQSDIALVGWPPSVDGWVKFLLALRPTVGSYKRFQGVVGNVIEVATRFWSQRRDMPAAQLNPAFLYDAMHHRTLHIVKRSWGMGVTQVKGITMLEARNAVHFADSDSVRGIAACAAFCMGVVMGGRRPRTLTAIRLAHIRLQAAAAVIDNVSVVVPQLYVEFHQEKFDCKQGPRTQHDKPHAATYGQEFWSSPAFWVYRLLVIRGCFVHRDPIIHAKVGDSLEVRQTCLHYYLFCDVGPNFWIDTAPVSVGTLGTWTKMLLKRMGSRPRGYSAHRPGFVARACILGVMHSEGQGLPTSTLIVVVRAGGWQAVTGVTTILKTYARKVIDEHIDLYSISLGYDIGKQGWEDRVRAYLGAPLFPKQAGLIQDTQCFPCKYGMLPGMAQNGSTFWGV